MERNKNWNILFIIISMLGCVFVAAPLLLRIPFVRDLLSWFLQPLKDSGYKSSYIETFGAILGTFLAVAGTLWTQRKIDEASDKKEIKECALIVYYDFEFALKDLVAIMQLYTYSQRTISNVLLDYEEFKKRQKRCRIYIDDDWIHNVARLSHVLASNEIQQIYTLYGDLCTIKTVFNSSADEISEDGAKRAYSVIFHLCSIERELGHSMPADVKIKKDIVLLMERIKEIAQIKD